MRGQSLRSDAVLPLDWIEHRRADGELLGWMLADGEGFRVFDLLGRERTSAEDDGAIDWLTGEELLDELGIGYLADQWTLCLPDGAERPVRIAEVSARGITVVADEFGAASVVGADPERFRVPFPVTDELRPR
ncbi:hypothetical protein B1729_01475 [Microbacterium sp. B35-04]|uniref:hypothetical protein n=1 Tax=unclassified Microbacterium TaxID=2609290 RepID=UPI0013D5AB92|nr:MULTISPECIES: hypothetical protein [unclassified Microbacterium]KAF2415177.1 hypothetical protein B1729_01475 [Microbacterium sp. B35-04]KAF2420069.1 hypothetical protein B2K11_02740 [Microbacterium sp. B35-30]